MIRILEVDDNVKMSKQKHILPKGYVLNWLEEEIVNCERQIKEIIELKR